MDGAEVERVEVCRQKVENNVKIKEYGGCFGYPKQPFFVVIGFVRNIEG